MDKSMPPLVTITQTQLNDIVGKWVRESFPLYKDANFEYFLEMAHQQTGEGHSFWLEKVHVYVQ